MTSQSQPAATPAFRIRPARRGDADAIAALLAELGYPGAGDTQTVHWVISHPEMEIFVAADSHDRAVGMITLSHRPQLRMKGRIATLDELIVTASCRRRGLGRDLIKRAVARAKVLSVKRLELVTHSPRGEYPQAFYEACGLIEEDAAVLRMPVIDFNR
ncbi:MAG: GNAT family N-acetyltransferase [Myxococcaceae bacterium]